MSISRTIALFVVAAVAEIGGAWLIWQGAREHRGVAWIGAGIAALAAYGFVATLQADSNFGRVLAAYGGIFVAGSLAWGIVMDGFEPNRYDYVGAAICLVGVAVIMFRAPAGLSSGSGAAAAGAADLRSADRTAPSCCRSAALSEECSRFCPRRKTPT